jgi:hypothetical protein
MPGLMRPDIRDGGFQDFRPVDMLALALPGQEAAQPLDCRQRGAAHIAWQKRQVRVGQMRKSEQSCHLASASALS